MTIGIYLLTFDDDSKVYIGQSTNIERRLQEHSNLLSNNRHYNTKLQHAYNGTINSSIVHICTIDELNNLEIEYIKEFDSIDNGYNITLGGSSGGRGIYASKSLYTRNQLIDIFKSLADSKLSNIDISKCYDVPVTLVESIAYNKRHAWLSEEFPEIRAIIDNNVRSGIRFKSSNNINKRSKIVHKVLSPTNQIFEFSNISAFAKEHGLNRSHLCQLLQGNIKHHKQWKEASK